MTNWDLEFNLLGCMRSIPDNIFPSQQMRLHQEFQRAGFRVVGTRQSGGFALNLKTSISHQRDSFSKVSDIIMGSVLTRLYCWRYELDSLQNVTSYLRRMRQRLYIGLNTEISGIRYWNLIVDSSNAAYSRQNVECSIDLTCEMCSYDFNIFKLISAKAEIRHNRLSKVSLANTGGGLQVIALSVCV